MITASLFRYFVIAGLINAIVFAVVLLSRRQRTTAVILLAFLMVIISFQALLNAFDSQEFFLRYPNLFRISWLQLSLVGPLIYLFTNKVTGEHNKLQKKDLVHLVPFILYTSILLPWFLKPTSEKRKLLQQFDTLSQHDFGWLNQLSLLLITLYIVLSIVQQNKYKRSIKGGLSETGKRKFEWIKQFLYALLAILFISALGFYGRKLNIPVITNFYHYNYLIVVAMVYWLGYKLLSEPDLLKETPLNAFRKYEKSGLPEEALKDIHDRLLEYIKVEKPYLDANLSLDALATNLKVPRHHLSQTINTQSGKTFYDFINAYRVAEAKQRLRNADYMHLTIQGIAFDSGFNSKATFNTAFNKLVGMTPSAYRKLA